MAPSIPLLAALRAGDPEIVSLFREVLLDLEGDLDAAAKALGASGRSSIYRITNSSAPGAAAVRSVIAANGRKPGRTDR